jgi:type II secretory pathway component PulF
MKPSLFESPAAPNWSMAALQVGLHWSLFLAVGVMLGMIVPRFARMAMEFDLPLPAPAVLAFNMSLLTERVGWYVLPAVAIGDAALLLVLRLCGKEGVAISNLWTAVLFVAIGVLLLFVIVAVASPMVTLIQGLN